MRLADQLIWASIRAVLGTGQMETRAGSLSLLVTRTSGRSMQILVRQTQPLVEAGRSTSLKVSDVERPEVATRSCRHH